MGEWKRIFNWKLILLIFVTIAFNIILFGYDQFAGRSFLQFTFTNKLNINFIDRYGDVAPKEALEKLGNEQTAIIGYIRQQRNVDSQDSKDPYLVENEQGCQQMIDYYEALTDSEKTQMILEMKNMSSKLTYISNYQSSVTKVKESAANLKRATLFSNPKSFSYNNILKTASDYDRVKDVSLILTNDRAVEKFTDYYYNFYIAFALMVIIIYNLLSERENGMWSLVHNAPKGRGAMAIKRLLLIFSGSFVITGLLYVSTLIASLILYGGWNDLNTPIQTISSFGKFTYTMNKSQYLLNNFLISWFAIFIVSVILWMLFVVFRNRNHTLVIVGVFLGVEILLFQKVSIQSNFNYLKYINVVNLICINKIYCTYSNWGFGTHVFGVFSILFFVMFILMSIAVGISIVKTIFMRPETKTTILNRLFSYLHSKYQKVFMHFPVTVKELHKLIITGKGLWVVMVVIIIAIYFSSIGVMHFTDRQNSNDKMYLEHGGKDYSYIVQYVENEKQLYNEAAENYKAVSEQYKNEEVDLKLLADAEGNLRAAATRLTSISEFRNKADYLQMLKDKQGIDGYMISDRGYEEIFGQYSRQRELILLLTIVTGIMIIISESISMEYRTGMENIVRSCKNGRGWILRRKVAACIIFTSVLFLIVYGIDIWNLNHFYGMPYLDAPIMSLTFMEGCAFKVSILGWITILLAVRLIVCLVTMVIAIIISRMIGKKGNRALMLLVLAVLLAIIVVVHGMRGML